MAPGPSKRSEGPLSKGVTIDDVAPLALSLGQ